MYIKKYQKATDSNQSSIFGFVADCNADSAKIFNRKLAYILPFVGVYKKVYLHKKPHDQADHLAGSVLHFFAYFCIWTIGVQT